jgi:cytochrome c oxidase cbb3-type subunit 3
MNNNTFYLVLAVLAITVILLFFVIYLTIDLKNYSKSVLLSKEDYEAYKSRIRWIDLFNRTKVRHDEEAATHVYDDIHELDNAPPAWFNYLFYVTILVAVGYMLRYHVFKTGMLQGEEYAVQMEEAKALAIKLREKAIKLADLPPMKASTELNDGKVVYIKNCVMCHGDKGQGNVGPNLTDAYWIHGASYKNVFTTIFNGVPEKGMLSWKNTLSPVDIQKVSSYVYTLKNTNAPGGKAPQGQLANE